MYFSPILAAVENTATIEQTSTTTTIPDAGTVADASATMVNNPPRGGGLMSMMPIIIVFAVMIFFMMRSQKKQAQKHQQMLDKVMRGTKVLLNSGMYGTVTEVKPDSFVVEIADKVRVEVVKNGISNVITEEKDANPKADK